MSLFGQLLSVPLIFLFFAAWVASSLVRPLAYISALGLIARPLRTARKVHLFCLSLLFLVLCNDKSWKQPNEDPQSFFAEEANGSPENGGAKKATKVRKKTVIFVRHGESTWNDTFNRGGRSKLRFVLCFVPNLIWAVFVELYFFVSGKCNESWFFDSPLSSKGVLQASDIRTFLQSKQHITAAETEMLDLMTGKTKSRIDGDACNDKRAPASQLVSSNLRRSISTMALGFADRLDRKFPGDSILILPQLQEISRNPDALSITPPKGKVLPSWVDREITHCDVGRIFKEQVDATLNNGNKPINTNGLKRMDEFCTIAFSHIKKDIIIVGGHSLWFRSFFRTFLPRDFDHISKRKKLINGACASFTLLMMPSDSGDKYMIDPKSVHVIYGGF